MNPTHIHLLITHLPIYGTILGAIVLSVGLISRSRSTCNAAYIVLLIAAIGGVMAYLTGEPAEETVEKISGISKNLIEEHEESANLTLILIIITGLSSCVALFFARKNYRVVKSLPVIVLIVTVACFGAAARTGYLGGKIRHTEVYNTSNNIYQNNQ